MFSFFNVEHANYTCLFQSNVGRPASSITKAHPFRRSKLLEHFNTLWLHRTHYGVLKHAQDNLRSRLVFRYINTTNMNGHNVG